ncbi:MAG: hypothetical protein GC155_00625 [Alphaproteobacteria bacterium]|nr:hypothetical protein [Alphaproteobacteria bacterium]
MAERAIFIRAAGDYYAQADEALPELGPLVKQTLGAQVRRVGRFVQLALIGAARCVGQRQLPATTGVYLTSGRGDMEVTADVMEQLFRDGQAPRPLSFINTVSNSACFYIAKQFGLRGRSAFVCNRYFSFESALQLAMLDMEAGVSTSALVGSTDIVLAPLDVHRKRLRLAEGTPVAEGSHWLWLEAGDAADEGAKLTSVEVLADGAALETWIARHARGAGTALSVGQFGDATETAAIAARAGVTPTFDYRDGRAYYDSQSGAAVSAFLAQRPEGVTTLLHVNRDAEGRFAAFAVRF